MVSGTDIQRKRRRFWVICVVTPGASIRQVPAVKGALNAITMRDDDSGIRESSAKARNNTTFSCLFAFIHYI